MVLRLKRCTSDNCNESLVSTDAGDLFFPAAADDKDTGEYHECCKDLLPCKDVHGEDDADDCCDDRLYVAVHADQGRADALLTERNKEIAHECREYDEIS